MTKYRARFKRADDPSRSNEDLIRLAISRESEGGLSISAAEKERALTCNVGIAKDCTDNRVRGCGHVPGGFSDHIAYADEVAITG